MEMNSAISVIFSADDAVTSKSYNQSNNLLWVELC